jgi:hypothetical protein
MLSISTRTIAFTITILTLLPTITGCNTARKIWIWEKERESATGIVSVGTTTIFGTYNHLKSQSDNEAIVEIPKELSPSDLKIYVGCENINLKADQKADKFNKIKERNKEDIKDLSGENREKIIKYALNKYSAICVGKNNNGKRS